MTISAAMDNTQAPQNIGGIKMGEDTTGLCTVREIASFLIEERDRTKDTDFEDLHKNMECEMFFVLGNGTNVNVEIKVTKCEQASV